MERMIIRIRYRREKKIITKYKNIKFINDYKDIEIINEIDEDECLKFIVENVEQFAFRPLLNYLENRTETEEISNFELIKFLKIQYVNDYIKNKIIVNEFRNFMVEIFCSNTINNLLKVNYTNGNILEKEDYIKIINSIEYFNFEGSTLGETNNMLNVKISVYNKKYNTLEDELAFYCLILIAYMHEIFDHILLRVQKQLFDEKIQSPQTKDDKYSEAARKREKESGEYFHVKLFGKLITSLTEKEIYFLFEPKNYSEKDYRNFTREFSNCKNKNNLTIPKVLTNLLRGRNQYTKITKIDIEIYRLFRNADKEIQLIKGGKSWCRIFEPINDLNDD